MNTSNTAALLRDGEAAARQDAGDVLHSTEEAIERIASRAQDMATRGIHAASDAGAKVQKWVSHYTEATSRYVAEQPVRSVLIAAAAGAALAALVIAASRRRD